MKRLIPTFAILLACASIAWAAAPSPLTTLRAIHALTNAEARRQLPVAFEATVTYYRDYEGNLFVQDGDAAIYVSVPYDLRLVLVPGDRVRIEGTIQPSFHPYVAYNSIAILRRGPLPKPLAADFAMLMGAAHDCQLVTVHGVVRAADVVKTGSVLSTKLKVLTDGGLIEVNIDSTDASAAHDLLDAEVEIIGVAAGLFDGKLQQTGILIHAQTLAFVKVLKRASASPWSLPVTPMDQILATYHVKNLTERIRVHGTITYYRPGSAVVLQDGSKSLWIGIMSRTSSPLRIGDLADASGFADAQNGFLTLTDGDIRDDNIQAPIVPPLLTWQKLATGGNIFDLVSIEGQVVTEVREGNQDEYILRAGDKLFSAIFTHPYGVYLPPMKQIPLGSRIRVTGVCILSESNPWDGQVPFKIQLRVYDDISVVARPSLVNTRNLLLALGVLLLVVFAVIARGWVLERKVRRQTAALSALTEVEAELERQRSRILEDINGSRPLAEILEEITELVSIQIKSAPCWCEVADGARLGNCPNEPHGLRIVRAEIPARSGLALGTIYAALHPQAPPATRVAEALHSGVRLATLAIETRKLYSDLRHRSEFDLLTDIPNRFAMEKFMELQIEEASHCGRLLGLIYIDLDKFKPINDTYGHHVGDLYLQAVALRMSRQLLGGDMLARLGGDEFAAMVLLHHGRSDMEKIVSRLQSCFDEPFAVEGIILHGEASIGVALFPEDGATKDNLLNAADAAMYIVKNAKRPTEKSLPQSPHSEISAEVRA
ncbi:MAG: diguanylate cyclase domain-containing protein [Terracidiphilus sp.]